MKIPHLHCTAIITHEVLDKIGIPSFHALENELSDTLALSNYGSSVERIGFIFISVDPDDNFHEESIEYSRRRKEIVIAHRLPGIELLQAAPEEILPLLASAYLASIEKYPALKIRDFDHLRFRQDVQQLFEKKGWLVGQEV